MAIVSETQISRLTACIADEQLVNQVAEALTKHRSAEDIEKLVQLAEKMQQNGRATRSIGLRLLTLANSGFDLANILQDKPKEARAIHSRY